MKKIVIAAVALAVALSLPVQSKNGLLSGQINHDRINQLTSQIPWYHSLGQAEDAAMRQGKMIFWMHMLGSLNGAT